VLCDNLDIFNLKLSEESGDFPADAIASGCLEVDGAKINRSKCIVINGGIKTDGVGLIDIQMVKQMPTHFLHLLKSQNDLFVVGFTLVSRCKQDPRGEVTVASL